MSARNVLAFLVSGLLAFGCNEPPKESERPSVAFAGWIKGIERVDAVLYDCGDDMPTLIKDGNFHPGLVEEKTKALSEAQIEDLERYVTNDKPNYEAAGCYSPHHGFVFYGENDQILGCIEVCLMCGQGYEYPEGDISEDSLWDLAGIQTLLEELGMPTFEERAEWDAYFAKIRRVEPGATGQPATRSKSK